MKTAACVSGSASFRLGRTFLSIFALLALVGSLGARERERRLPKAKSAPAQSLPAGPKIWLADAQNLQPTHVGAKASAQSVAKGLAAGQGTPLAMINGDFDGDGIEDLAVGYATANGGAIVLHRGNLDAFAPQSEASFQAIGRGQFPSPFLAEAKVYDIPIRPDFIAAGDFMGSGRLDLVVASRGRNTLFVLANDGTGKFKAPQIVQLTGTVTTLAAENLGIGQSFGNVLVGLSGPNKTFSLLVLGGTELGFGAVGNFPLLAAASNINFGDFGDRGPDAAFLSGDQVVLLHSSTMQLESLSLPVSVSALALGSFLYDRNPDTQIALLDSNGSIHIVVHSEFDPRVRTIDEMKAIRDAVLRREPSPLIPRQAVAMNGWKIVESIPSATPFTPGQPPMFMRTRVSNHGPDDVMVLNASLGQMAVILHPDPVPGAATFQPAQISTRPYVGSPIAAISIRVNVDGRPGVIALHGGQVAPLVVMPLPDPTFFVNTTTDPAPTSPIANACNNVSFADVSSSCSLREAVLKANGDTIMLQAGTTYTLTRAKVGGDFSGNNGALYVNNSVTIVGGNQNTTIVQAGTTPTNGVDMVMAVNEDISPTTNASASVSNLTMKFGNNRGTHGNDGDGGCMEFDTGTSGTATLALTNVTLTDCTTHQGNGGGIAIFNFLVNGVGQPTITNSIIQNNTVNETIGGTSGGGIWVSNPARMLMTNSQVINNVATQLNGAGRGLGGGIRINANGTTWQTVIHSSTISGNQASGPGGGIWSDANLQIDQGTIISNNAAGANGGGAQDGGGLFHNPQPAQSASLSKVTITGNSATGTGGGVASGNLSIGGPLTMNLSRLANNTAPTGSNFNNLGSVATVTDDWWATNTPATTINTSAGTTTFTPWINLTHQGSPNLIRIGDTSTLTVDFRHRNTDPLGSPSLAATTLDVFSGLPITFSGNLLGTITGAQPFIENQVNISTATESGCPAPGPCTATITTTTPHGFSPGQTVTISGVGVFGYDGEYTLVTASGSTFTYSNPVGGLAASSGGTAGVPTGQATATYTATNGGIETIDATVDGVAATATITILFPPSIAKAFGATHIPVGGTTSLTFTITNINTANALNGLAFTDTLPAGLVVATPNGLANTCAGTPTAVAGSGSISFTGGVVGINTTCTLSVNVTGVTDGVQNNTSGNVTATDAGGLTGNTASASITVINPPTIAKSFGAATVPLNGTTSLSFTVSNSNANSTLNGVAFTDSLPAGLVVATPNGLTGSCGASTITAVAGSSTVSLSGATFGPTASCTFSVNVTGTTAGLKNNSVAATSTNVGGLTGNTSNANLTVVGPPVIIKAFGAASIPLNGSTSLTFTIQNNNTATTLTGVAFSDTLPAGLAISTPNGQSGSCGGGTITATQATSVISLSGASLAASTSCTFAINVTGITAGAQNNTTGNVTSTEGGTGGTASASVAVVTPPTIAKAFGAANIPLNGTTSLTLTMTNPAANSVALTGIAFTDSLPAGLVVATPNGLTNSCGGAATAVAGSGSVTLTAGSIATPGNTCNVVVNVTGTTSGIKNNTTGAVSSTNGGTGGTSNTASLTVAVPPTITKAFDFPANALGGPDTLTFNITNPNAGVALTGVAFTDNLPAGLIVANPNGLTNSCGGTATAVIGSGSVSLSGGTLATSGSCTVSVTITSTTAGLKNNSVTVTSTEGGTGNTSNASITIVTPPVIIKAFGAASIPLNGSTSLTFTIQNNNAGTTLTGVSFSDTLPAGLVIATPNGLTGSCGGGTITATQATNVISLTGASLASSTSCTFAVNVTGTAAGAQNNTTGNVNSNEGGVGGTASASLAVVGPPTIAKAFGGANIPLNGTTSLTLTITNPVANSVALTGIAFTDSLPAGLVVATPNGLTNTCGGSATAVAGSGTVTLSAGTIATPGNACTVVVNVSGTTSGMKNNTTGAVSSTNGGTGNTATANLTVATPPTITKAFGAANIPLNGTTSLTLTITNPNAGVGLTGVAFTDTLPAGLVVASTPNLNSTCVGTATAIGGAGSVSLSGGTLATSASCTVSVDVSGTTAGVKNNSVQVTSTEGGTGNTSNAPITVVGPPVIIKAFGAASIPLNGSTSLTFTIQNNNTGTALTGVGFSDTLPAGLVIATPNGLAGGCGGGTITATQATNVISLSGSTLAASASCNFAINVTGTAAGTQNNTTGNVTSTQGGTGGTASASIAVVGPPSIAKAFNPTAIVPSGTSALSFTITNPAANTVALTGVAFTDTLPAGVTVATPNGLIGACGGGTITATAASGSISLSGATIATSASCTFSVNVTSATPGSVTNTTSAVTSTNGGMGNTASANLSVATPPSISKSFGAASIGLANSTSLSFTITNPNAAVALTSVAFTDTLPGGLVVATPNGLTGTCGSGTITATAGSAIVSLSGGTIATNSSCTFAVNVTAITAGNQVNTTGAVTAANGGTGNTATASITVLAPDLTITKSHTGNFFQGQTGATYTLTVNNIGPGPTAGTVTVTDTLPAGLTATALAGTGWNCTLGTLTCTRSDALASATSYPAITVTVNVAANAAASVTNNVTVSGGGELNVANDGAANVTTVTLPPDFTLSFNLTTITIRAGQTASYALTVTPQNNVLPNPIAFAVSGLPGKTSFVFNPATLTPGANPATTTLVVSTTAGDPFVASNSEKSRTPLYALLLPFSGLVLSGLGFRKRKLRKGRSGWVLIAIMLVCSGFGLYGCAGAQKNFQNLGTPTGTYTVTITATSGAVQHSAPVSLIVQP